MPTTPSGLPYPESSGPVAQGAENIKALAEKLAPVAAGRTAISVSNAANASKAIVFPAGRFDKPPAVTVSCETFTWFGSSNAATAAGVTVTCRRADGTNATGTVQVNWIAVGTG